MPQTLEAWQHKVERHFADLTASRSATNLPIFALEHSLSADEFTEIAIQLRARVTAYRPLGDHWLLWVIYATEQGYAYDGHEFWDSYEAQTPRWREHESRAQFKTWFRQFQKTYNGVIPKGRWARQFNNIVWPIHHAILPKYLQYQFAQALHGLRFKLARMESLEPSEIGKLLAANSWNASKRLREFLQHEELAGRIVLALLNRDVGEQELIYSPTLSRIIGDLERVHKAKEWLKETRRAADIFRGAQRQYNTAGSGAPIAPSSPVIDSFSLRMRPSIMLRKMDKESWSAILDIPDFSPIAALNQDLANFLRTTRCQVSGEGIWQPAGWLLTGMQRRALKTWPDVGQPVLKFERPSGLVENILNADFRLPSLACWLFRVGDDGLAYQVTGLTVRAGHQYVLLSNAPIALEYPILRPCEVRCHGVEGVALEIPNAVSHDDTAFLQKLGLQVNRTIRTWPTGLIARGWDYDGYSEWLTTESPRFGIVHDHPVETYRVSLDDRPAIDISAQKPGVPTFIELPLLLPGRHSVRISARRTGQADATALKDMDGVLVLDVRDPVPWHAGTTDYSGLFVTVEPVDPSLDQLSEGSLLLSVSGPEGVQVSVRLALASRTGAQLFEQELAKFELPIAPSAWLARIGHLIANEKFAWKLIEATVATLKIGNDDLGWFTLRLEREARPLRWVCRNSEHQTYVKLTDDTGSDAEASLSYRSFREPATDASLNYGNALAGLTAADPGGLYMASHSESRDAIVVCTPQVHSFQQLLVAPDQRILLNLGFRELLGAAALWRTARLAGPLAAMRRDHVVGALLRTFYTKLCGDRWARFEEEFVLHPSAQGTAEELQRMFERKSAGFSVVLRRDFVKMDEDTGSGMNWFADAANRYGICSDVQLCETALKVASNPFDLLDKSDAEIHATVQALCEQQSALRGARLVALCSILSKPEFSKELLPRWQWS